MSNSSGENITEQLRRVAKDAVDYFQSAITLLQARFAEMALSSVLFVILMVLATLLALASFLMFNIAFGVWLAHVLGSVGWCILILGTIYGILAWLSGNWALRWLKNLKS